MTPSSPHLSESELYSRRSLV